MEKRQAKMNNFYRAKIEKKKKRVLGPIPEEENEDPNEDEEGDRDPNDDEEDEDPNEED